MRQATKKTFLLSESVNIIEKSCFYQELWSFKNGLKGSKNFYTKNADFSKIKQIWEITGIFLQNLYDYYTIIVQKLMFLANPYLDI